MKDFTLILPVRTRKSFLMIYDASIDTQETLLLEEALQSIAVKERRVPRRYPTLQTLGNWLSLDPT